MGGLYLIGIESIRLIQSHKNYEIIMKLLYCLDGMISGFALHKDAWDKIGKRHINTSRLLIENQKKEYDNSHTDKYIMDTFNNFIQNKQHIHLWLDSINKSFVHRKMRELIMNPMEQEANWKVIKLVRDSDDVTNLLSLIKSGLL